MSEPESDPSASLGVNSDISVRSIFGARTQRGLVELTLRDLSASSGQSLLGERTVSMFPAKAREVATFLLEAASAAEGDEILMRVLDRAGLSPQRAAQVLMAMRQERAILERRARAEARRAVAEDQHDPDTPER